MQSIQRFAILSHILPPAWSGQSIVLYRLLKDVVPETYCLITAGREVGSATDDTLTSRLCTLDRPSLGWEYLAALSGLLAARVVAGQIERRARQVEKILRDNDVALLVACSGDLLDIPAGALAAKRAGVVFVPYYFDDYCYQWTGWRRSVAQQLEQKALGGAIGALVPNEFLAEEYRRRYGLVCQVIRNPVLPQIDVRKIKGCARKGSRKRIVYTGSVYHAHYDAFRNLVKTLEQEGMADLYIYTAQSAAELARQGIAGSFVQILGHVDQQEALEIQETADILFLPLAFSSTIPEVLRTSAPGKMGEYLASGTPILVHAPADSFLCWFFRKYRCGEVVDAPDCRLLAEGVRRLLGGGDGVEKMIVQAREVAVREFDAGRQAEIFYRYLQTIIGRIS